MLHTLLLLAQLTIHAIPNGMISKPRPTVEIRVRVKPDPANRGIALDFYSEDYYAHSEKDMDGRAIHIFRYANLPEGEYHVTVVLLQWKGKWVRKEFTLTTEKIIVQ